MDRVVAPNVLVCTGFHRSATSLSAQWLHNAGLNMGHELMPGGISNPFGHFEDLPAVKMHDRWLAQAGTDWKYHGQCPLVFHEGQSNELLRYVHFRSALNAEWGVKDPRICLYLEQWHNALQGRGRYLIVLRHWASCIDSLFRRHSEEIAFPRNANALANNIQFWQKPTLGARMWLFYCYRLLTFITKFSDKCIVVTQKQIFSNLNLALLVRDKFNFELKADTKSPVVPGVLEEKVNSSLNAMLPSSLRLEMGDLWEKLLSFSDGAQCVDESVNWTAAHYQQVLVSDRSLASGNLGENLRVLNNDVDDQYSIAKLFSSFNCDSDLNELANAFDTLPDLGNSLSKRNQIKGILDWFYSNGFSDSECAHLSFSRWVQNQDELELANICWRHCLNKNHTPAYVYHYLAQYEYSEGRFAEAKGYIELALQKNAANPHNWLLKSKLHAVSGENVEAKAACLRPIEGEVSQPIIYILVANQLDAIGAANEAIELIDDLVRENHGLSLLLLETKARLLLKQGEPDSQESIKLYRSSRLETIANRSLYLYEGCVQAGSKEAEIDFYNRVTGHWRKLQARV